MDDHATNYTPLHLLKTTENLEMLAHKWEANKGICDRMCSCNVLIINFKSEAHMLCLFRDIILCDMCH